MDKWTMIIIEAEDMWQSSAAARSITARDLGAEEYRRTRDRFKARRIYDMYGYEYFRMFVDRCPHISDILEDYKPCMLNKDGQCVISCNFYQNGGCKDAAK